MATSCLSLALTGKEGRESTSMRKPGRAGVGVGVVDVDSHSGKTDWLAGMEGEGARDMLPERSAMCMACGTDCRWPALVSLCLLCLYSSSLLGALFPSSQLCQTHTVPPSSSLNYKESRTHNPYI